MMQPDSSDQHTNQITQTSDNVNEAHQNEMLFYCIHYMVTITLLLIVLFGFCHLFYEISCL